MKRTLITLSILALSSSAFALGDATYNQGGLANANGGSVIGSGNSSNLNTNTNANANTNLNNNTQGQAQGQQQGQAQGQMAVGVGGQGGAGGSASAGASSTSNSGSNTLTTGSNTSAVSVVGDTVTYQAQDRNPVSSAYAANLSSANGTCMGSTSGGAQGASFGFSIGSTWVDGGCDARYDSMALAAAGLKAAATARLCMKAEIAQAMANAGTPCKATKAAPAAAPVAAMSANGYAGNDPIVKARMAK